MSEECARCKVYGVQISARGLCESCQEGTKEEVRELALCEATRLVLIPGALYRFSVIAGCQSCADAAEGL